jgi:flavin-dependent thymidylate synthase
MAVRFHERRKTMSLTVTLAGYNVDADVISERLDDDPSPVTAAQKCTPEVLSAAYARISRDPRPIGELRAGAARDVEKARKSNQDIVFGMGHASIAEHAVFNFDITGISRLAIEYLESHRLCSYTEKSQRYIRLGKDFVTPHEAAYGTAMEGAPRGVFLELVKRSTELYEKFFPKLLEYFQDTKPGAAKSKQKGWAQEDARYVALMATTGQLGLTASARNLELIIRRCASSPLQEVRDMGKQLYQAASTVAPSLFRHVEPSPYEQKRVSDLREVIESFGTVPDAYPAGIRPTSNVCFIDPLESADDMLCEALMCSAVAGWDAAECADVVSEMGEDQKRELVRTALKHLEFYDAAPREFEHVQFMFELRVSASCFAQLKRHRMMTLTPQRYDTTLTPTVPKSIQETGLEEAYLYHCRAAVEVYDAIAKVHGEQVAEYALTNGHKRRVLVTMNLRELYHFSRMRQDGHAQWDIRNIANQMVAHARGVAPLGTMLVCGKDQFVEKVREVYGGDLAAQKKVS